MLLYFKKIIKVYDISKIIKKSFIEYFIIFLIDYYNIITTLLENYKVFIYSIVIIIFIFFIIDVIKNKFYKIIKLKSINEFDKFLITSLLILTLCIINFTVFYYPWKISLFILIIIVLLLLVKRIILINKISRKSIKVNTYTLNQLCSGVIKTNNLILLDQKEADYDLFDRGYLRDNLKNIILKCYPNESFVISLLGNWGTGKSTVIKNTINLIKPEECIIVSSFKPWQYNDNYNYKG